jgi:hypothetical protein
MSNTLNKLNIDLAKIPGAKQITGKDGTNYLAIDTAAGGVYAGAKGVYLNLDMRENRDGEDQYGNTHMLTMSPTKEQREAKERTPIVGNAKTLVFGQAQQSRPVNTPKNEPQFDEDGNEDIPF